MGIICRTAGNYREWEFGISGMQTTDADPNLLPSGVGRGEFRRFNILTPVIRQNLLLPVTRIQVTRQWMSGAQKFNIDTFLPEC